MMVGMMRNRILEIVVFLIDYMQGANTPGSGSDDVSSVLEAEGYSEDEISSAYSWLLQHYDSAPEQYFSDFPPSPTSVRILTPSERTQLSSQAQGFLLKLLHLSLIDSEQLEMVLERVSTFGPRAVNLDQMKLIASSVVLEDLEDFESVSLSQHNETLSLRIN